MKRGFLALAFFLTACTSSVTPVSPVQNIVRLPDDNQLKVLLSDFEKYSVQAQKDWRVPGMAIAITKKDKVIYSKGFGLTREGGSAVNDKTIFQIGSTSKAFTATMVAQQVAEGKLAWNDTVASRLPEFKMYDNWVTQEFRISDLMAQHSGLPGYGGDQLLFLGNGTRAEIVERIPLLKPVSSFRSGFAYMNNLFVAAGSLIEKASGNTWEENLQKRILDPLEMTDTTYSFPSFKSASDVAWNHYYDLDRAVAGTVPAPAAISMDWPMNDWTDTAGPAGGINSNVLDMAKWLQLQLGKGARNGVRLLEESQLSYLQTPKTPIAGTLHSYCDGWMYTEGRPYSYVWHNGATLGAHSIVGFMPEAGVGIVVLTNLVDHQLPEALMQKFFDLYCGNPAKDWSATMMDSFKKTVEPNELKNGVPALPLQAYAGTYRNSFYGPVEVVLEGTSLKAYLGARRIAAPLTSCGDNLFRTTLDGPLNWPLSFEGTPAITKLSIEGMKDAVEESFLKQ